MPERTGREIVPVGNRMVVPTPDLIKHPEDRDGEARARAAYSRALGGGGEGRDRDFRGETYEYDRDKLDGFIRENELVVGGVFASEEGGDVFFRKLDAIRADTGSLLKAFFINAGQNPEVVNVHIDEYVNTVDEVRRLERLERIWNNGQQISMRTVAPSEDGVVERARRDVEPWLSFEDEESRGDIARIVREARREIREGVVELARDRQWRGGGPDGKLGQRIQKGVFRFYERKLNNLGGIVTPDNPAVPPDIPPADPFAGDMREWMKRAGARVESGSDRDPLLIEIDRTVWGGLFTYRAGMGYGMPFENRREQRVLDPAEAFSAKRVSQLLADAWAEKIRVYNGEVTDSSMADISPLTNAGGAIDRRIVELKKLIAGAMEGTVGDLHFPSLVPNQDESYLSPRLKVISEKVKLQGYRALTPAEQLEIPEVRAFHDLEEIQVWHEAQTQLINTLRVFRISSVGKEIDAMAGLAKDKTRNIWPTSKIIDIFSLDGLPGCETTPVSTFEETAKRLYKEIADVAMSPVEVSAIGELLPTVGTTAVARAKELLIRRLLTVRDYVAEGSPEVSKDDRYVMNRFAVSLNPSRLARLEAFVSTMAFEGEKGLRESNLFRDNTLSASDITGSAEFIALESSLKMQMDIAEQDVINGTSSMTRGVIETDEQRAVKLGCANAVGIVHALGEADVHAELMAWRPRKDDDSPTLPSYVVGGNTYVGVRRVGSYPACTAAVGLVHYTDKLKSDLAIYGIKPGAKTMEDALAIGGILPDQLYAPFLYQTSTEAIDAAGNVLEGNMVRLAELWESGLTLKQLAERMKGRVPETAYQTSLGQLEKAAKIRALLGSTKAEDYELLKTDFKLLGEMYSAVYVGLPMPVGEERNRVADRIYTMVLANLTVACTGMEGTQFSLEKLKSMNALKYSGPAIDELGNYIRLVINASLAKRKGAPSYPDGLRLYKRMVEPYFRRVRNAGMTDETLGAPALIVNPVPWRNGPKYRDIWNGLG